MQRYELACALICVLAACSPDGTATGVRGECAASSGLLCQNEPLETPEDACWKLVECGSIPVANPEGMEGCCFDWSRCVRHLERLETHRYDVSMACIEHSSCEQLRFDDGPERPGRDADDRPPCLEYGEQP